MTIHASMTDHDLLQILHAVHRIDPSQHDFAAQLGQLLQPVSPHDLLKLIRCSNRGCIGPMQVQEASTNSAIERWPISAVVQHEEPLLINDYSNEARWEPEANEAMLRSGLLAPLRTNRGVIGVLELGSTTPYAFSPSQRDGIEVLADSIASLIQAADLLHLERQQRERLEALDRIGYVIASSLDVGEVFETFAAQAAQLVAHEAISVTLLSEDGQALERFALATRTRIAPQAGERQPLNETVAGLTVRDGQTIWSNDMDADQRFRGTNDRRWIAEGFHSFISAPLHAKGRIIGSLNVLARESGFYARKDVATVEQVANQIAIFLDNMYLHARIRRLAVAEERNRLARDLHDTLMQSLTSIVLRLDAIEVTYQNDESLRTDLRQVRQVAQRALTEARSRLWELHPNVLEEQPLAQTLNNELASWQQICGVPARLFIRGEGDLPHMAEEAILRITQEALHNTHKYAHAHTVRVELEYSAHDVRLLISDDGIGFDPQHPAGTDALSSGFGLIAMSERARAVGGQLHVSSWPGNGTRIEALFPCERSEESACTPEANSQAALKARVLIVDDHTLIRQGLVELIKRIEGLCVVGELADGYAAFGAVRRLRPDLVLMDMRLPGIDGAAVTKQLLAEHPDLRVIMLTCSDEREDLIRAIEAGARGYILKEGSIEQFVETIRAVLRGEAVVERRITHHLVERLNLLLRDQHHNDMLSERELEVLRLIIEGYHNKDIAETLIVSEHTVKSHISNIFRKLGVRDRAGAISVALQHNLAGLSMQDTTL